MFAKHCHASLSLKVTRHFWSMPGVKWLVADFENPTKRVFQKHGYWGIRMKGRKSLTKLFIRKCLIRRIEINNEVNNDWRGCKKGVPDRPFSDYCAYILTIGQLLLRKFCRVLISVNQFILTSKYPYFWKTRFVGFSKSAMSIYKYFFDPLQKLTTVEKSPLSMYMKCNMITHN